MSGTEWVVVAAGLVFGYWVVNLLMGRGAPPATLPADAAPDVAPAHQPWHEVLGLPESASVDEIEAAHALLVARCRPEAVAGLGAEFQAVAARTAVELDEARRDARAARGLAP